VRLPADGPGVTDRAFIVAGARHLDETRSGRVDRDQRPGRRHDAGTTAPPQDDSPRCISGYRIWQITSVIPSEAAQGAA